MFGLSIVSERNDAKRKVRASGAASNTVRMGGDASGEERERWKRRKQKDDVRQSFDLSVPSEAIQTCALLVCVTLRMEREERHEEKREEEKGKKKMTFLEKCLHLPIVEPCYSERQPLSILSSSSDDLHQLKKNKGKERCKNTHPGMSTSPYVISFSFLFSLSPSRSITLAHSISINRIAHFPFRV